MTILALATDVTGILLGITFVAAFLTFATFYRKRTPALVKDWIKSAVFLYLGVSFFLILELLGEVAEPITRIDPSILLWGGALFLAPAGLQTVRIFRYHFDSNYRPKYSLPAIGLGVVIAVFQTFNGYIVALNYGHTLSLLGTIVVGSFLLSFVGAGLLLHRLYQGKEKYSLISVALWFSPYITLLVLAILVVAGVPIL